MFFPASDWFVAFVLTVALEVPVVLFVLRRAEPDLRRLGADGSILFVGGYSETAPVDGYERVDLASAVRFVPTVTP